MSEILKVRDSDGAVVGHYPDAAAAAGWEETGYTMVDLDTLTGEFDPCVGYIVSGTDLVIADLETVKNDQKALLSDVRDTAILATVETTDYGTFYTDDKSKLLLAGKLLGIMLMEGLGQTPPATVDFKRVDGWHSFTLAAFKLAALQVLGGIEAVFDEQKTLEDEIDTKTTRDDVQAIVWP